MIGKVTVSTPNPPCPYCGGMAGWHSERCRRNLPALDQLAILARDLAPLLQAVVAGYSYDLGDSDLDDEQPIHVRMSLGEYRRARRLLHEVEKLA